MSARIFNTLQKTIAITIGLAATVTSCLLLWPNTALASDISDVDFTKAIVSYNKNESIQILSTNSWYSSSLYLNSRSTIGQRYFDGNHVGIEMTAQCANDGVFTVSLYRSNGSLIGSATFRRNGFTKATWLNVGSGNYFFVCENNYDGKTIFSSDVQTYSW